MDKTNGTIITSNVVSTNNVETRQVHTDSLTINNSPITEISYSPLDNSSSSLVSSYALSELKKQYDKDIANFKKTLDNNTITPIVSEAITYPYFDSDSKWSSVNFVYQYGQAVYRNDNSVKPNQASLQISNDVFLWIGYYFVILDIEYLPNGSSIVLTNNIGDTITTIIVPGKHKLSIPVENINNYSILLTINNVPTDETVVVNRIYIYYVQERAMDFFRFMGEDIMSGGSGTLASTTWVEQKLIDNAALCNSYTDAKMNSISNSLSVHIGAKNGHNAVPSDIGAADREHTHVPSSIGAASKVHTHTSDECGAAPVDHTHVPSSIGAADREHTHTPDECGAAADSHNHKISTLVDAKSVMDHIVATGNVHGMVKGNIELGNVENYGIAGTSDYTDDAVDKYTTPGGMKSYLDSIFNDSPTKKYIPLAPKQILRTTLTLSAGDTYPLELNKNSVYEIYIYCRANINAGYLGMYIPEIATFDTSSTKYLNSFEYSTTVSGDNHSTWSAEQTNMCYLVPKNIGNNIVKGKLTLDTNMYTIFGEYQTWVGTMDGSTVVFASNSPYPIKSKCTFKEIPTISSNTINLVFKHHSTRNTVASSGPVVVEVLVNEYVNVGTEASIYDRSPLLSRIEFMGSKPPLGWSLENGTELERYKYLELAAFLIEYGSYLTLSEYNTAITNTGKCAKFAMSDTVIKLPTNPYTSSDGSIRIIKIKR